MQTETCKLYSRVFWIFLPNGIKIDPYNFELYRFKFGAFLRQCIYIYSDVNNWCIADSIAIPFLYIQVQKIKKQL